MGKRKRKSKKGFRRNDSNKGYFHGFGRSKFMSFFRIWFIQFLVDNGNRMEDVVSGLPWFVSANMESDRKMRGEFIRYYNTGKGKHDLVRMVSAVLGFNGYYVTNEIERYQHSEEIVVQTYKILCGYIKEVVK